MKSRHIQLHPEAEQEYLTVISWYGRRSLTAGIRFENAFQQALDKIKKSPLRWPAYFDDIRRYTLHRFPFNLFYRCDGDGILILAVAHARRKPNYWAKRR
jgi:plasmid stabilization system protein ParE